MPLSPADRRDVVRDALALITAAFDDESFATVTQVASDLAMPRDDESLVDLVSRLSSTAAVAAHTAAMMARHWSRAAGLDERSILERYTMTVSADLAARDLADGS